MSIVYEVTENVYRKPVEFRSAASYSLAAFSLSLLPVPEHAQLLAVPTLMTLAATRFFQGRRIRKYRKNLRKLPYYAMSPSQLPVSQSALFLGRGFEWTGKHTQRLKMARMEQNKKELIDDGKWYLWAREHEIRNDRKDWLSKLTRTNAWWNPVAPLPPLGGKTEIHGVEPEERDIFMDLADREGHMLIEGSTGVGKTRLAENIINQDIARGDMVVTIDPKGDEELMMIHYIAAKKYGRPFYLFHLGFPEFSCRYNPIGRYSRITEVATRISNQLPGDGQAASFKNFVFRFVNVLAKLMEALSIKPSFVELYNSAINIEIIAKQYFEKLLDKGYPDWKSDFEDLKIQGASQKAQKTGRSLEVIKMMDYIVELELRNELFDAVAGVLNNDRTYFDKLVSSLYPLLEKLTSGDIAQLISPDVEDLSDPRPILDWAKAIGENPVVYFGLDALTDQQVAAAVGNAAFADLTSLSGQIYKFGVGYGESDKSPKRSIRIHADEFNETAGDEFVPLLNKARGAGMNVTAYTQTKEDIEARVGSTAKAHQMIGNFNNIVMMRVQNIATAELMTSRLPEVEIIKTTRSSGANDLPLSSTDGLFSSKNEDKHSIESIPLLEPAELMSLPRGQAFALMAGGRLYKLRLPLPLRDPDIEIPENIKVLAEKMREKRRLNRSATNDNAFVEGKYYG